MMNTMMRMDAAMMVVVVVRAMDGCSTSEMLRGVESLQGVVTELAARVAIGQFPQNKHA
jgi:hypothetical protein